MERRQSAARNTRPLQESGYRSVGFSGNDIEHVQQQTRLVRLRSHFTTIIGRTSVAIAKLAVPAPVAKPEEHAHP